MKVSLFSTCLVDVLDKEVGVSTVELLERLGCEVEYNESQICCGQPAYNSGYFEEAKKGARNMIEVFKDSDYVVAPSGSCITMFKHYPMLFQDELIWKDRAQELSDKSYEISQFIVHVLETKDVGAELNGKAVIHPSCHNTRLLNNSMPPEALLSNVKGLELLDLPGDYNCCGFGGTFAVKMSEVSGEMVDEKAQSIIDTGADYLIGGDVSCLMNIEGRLRRLGSDIEVLHIAEVLNRAIKEVQ